MKKFSLWMNWKNSHCLINIRRNLKIMNCKFRSEEQYYSEADLFSRKIILIHQPVRLQQEFSYSESAIKEWIIVESNDILMLRVTRYWENELSLYQVTESFLENLRNKYPLCCQKILSAIFLKFLIPYFTAFKAVYVPYHNGYYWTLTIIIYWKQRRKNFPI